MSSEICNWLTEQLAKLPLVSYLFEVGTLPMSGIYFFYEKGELSPHGDQLPKSKTAG